MRTFYLKETGRGVYVAFLVWVLFSLFCRPIVALHYSPTASAPITFFFDSDEYLTKREMAPGASKFIPTTMNPASDMWITITFPFDSKDVLKVTQPFSRIDVYIGPGACIERTEIRHGFFARFTDPDFHDDWWH